MQREMAKRMISGKKKFHLKVQLKLNIKEEVKKTK
jgi:hypothetical protein